MKGLNKLNICIFCMLALLISISIGYMEENSTSSSFKTNEQYNPNCAGNTEIIIISNNSDLKDASTSGNGSQSNPYIIEDVSINGNGSLYCISINNTNKFFTIRRCTLYNSTYGIYLTNVTNGKIILNFIYMNFKAGLFIYNSFNNILLSNSIHDCTDYGILLNYCNYTYMRSNFIWNNNISGIFLYKSLYNNITSNTINFHLYPIFLQNSNFTFVISNTGYGNSNNIKELNCDNTNIFVGNTFRSATGTREDSDNNNSDNDAILLDFTLVLAMGIVSFCIITLLKFFQDKKE